MTKSHWNSSHLINQIFWHAPSWVTILPLMHLLAVSQLQQLCLGLSLHLRPSLSPHLLAAETAVSLITPTLCSAAFSGSFKVARFKGKAPGPKTTTWKHKIKDEKGKGQIALVQIRILLVKHTTRVTALLWLSHINSDYSIRTAAQIQPCWLIMSSMQLFHILYLILHFYIPYKVWWTVISAEMRGKRDEMCFSP